MVMPLQFVTISSYFIVSIVCLLVFLQQRKIFKSAAWSFFIMFFSFLSIGVAGLLSALGMNLVISEVHALHSILWGVVFAYAVSKISFIMKLRRMTFLAVASIFIVFALAGSFWELLLSFLGYYIAIASFFVVFMFSTRPIKNSGLYGQLGIFIMIFLTALGKDPLDILWIVPNVLIALGISYFYRFGLEFDDNIGPSKMNQMEADVKREKDKWKPIAYLIFYIILINLTIMGTTIVLHELGHLNVGILVGCEVSEIVLVDMVNPSIPGPYTTMSCPPFVRNNFSVILGFSGFLFVVPFAIAFLLLRRFPEKNLAYIIIGFNLGLASLDFLFVLATEIITYSALAGGVIVMCIGESFLVDDYVSYSRKKEQANALAKNIKK